MNPYRTIEFIRNSFAEFSILYNFCQLHPIQFMLLFIIYQVFARYWDASFSHSKMVGKPINATQHEVCMLMFV